MALSGPSTTGRAQQTTVTSEPPGPGASLPEPFAAQLAEKIRAGCELGFATITIVIKEGEPFVIEGPAPSERARWREE